MASHAQKYFIRHNNQSKRKRRTSLFDLKSDADVLETVCASLRFTLACTASMLVQLWEFMSVSHLMKVCNARSVCRDQLKPPLQPGQNERSSAPALLSKIHTQPHSSRQVITLTGVLLPAKAMLRFLGCGIHKVRFILSGWAPSTTSCCLSFK